MKFSVVVKKLKNPRVRRRLKIALSIYGVGIVLGVSGKIIYDVGYFNAQKVETEKKAKIIPAMKPELLTIDSAQRIVSGALREDPAQPQTVVKQILHNDRHISGILIETNKIKKVAWVIEMRLFFVGNLLDEEGHNLTKSLERQHNLNNADY